MLNISEGVKKTPLKVVIYGPESIGKTTLASQFPYALIVDVENGSNSLNVRRIRCDKSWEELLETLKEIVATPNVCKTVVVDTADWAEYLCSKYVCEKYKKQNIDDFGYGKGYTYLTEEFKKLLDVLDEAIDAGINVVVTAHAKPRKFELPEEMGAFDRYELKLTKNTAPIVKEWCDALLFCNFKTYVITDEANKKKAQGSRRTIYTTHSAVYDAKNRHNLPEEMDMTFDNLKPLFEEVKAAAPAEAAPAPINEKRAMIVNLEKMIAEAGITTDEFQEVVASRGHYGKEVEIAAYSDDFIARWVMPNWSKIVATINKTKAGN